MVLLSVEYNTFLWVAIALSIAIAIAFAIIMYFHFKKSKINKLQPTQAVVSIREILSGLDNLYKMADNLDNTIVLQKKVESIYVICEKCLNSKTVEVNKDIGYENEKALRMLQIIQSRFDETILQSFDRKLSDNDIPLFYQYENVIKILKNDLIEF